MAIGYLDTKRVLYGLYGRQYYIERSMTERQALELLLDAAPDGAELRGYIEHSLPRIARGLGAEDGGYYEILAALM